MSGRQRLTLHESGSTLRPVVVAHPEAAVAAQWVDALRRYLPGREVFADVDVDTDTDTGAAFAVAWRLPAGFFERHAGLEALFCTGAGVDGLLRDPRLPGSLPVIRLEDAGMAALMAEYCCHEVLRLRGRFADYERQQRERVWRELPVRDWSATRIGVLGCGVLGQAVALALRSLGYPVGVHRREGRLPERLVAAGIDGFSGTDDGGGLAAFLARTDVLILLAPLTPQTESLIDAQRLAQLPSGAWLINVARGALVDEQALLASLDAGHLAGATLDVVRQEPLPTDHPFWMHPRIRLTPHVSAPTIVDLSARQVADKILALDKGDPVTGLVDRSRGY